LIAKRIRTTGTVKSDYDRNATNYDRVRFGTAGGRYVDKKEQEFVARIIQSSRVLEVGTATGRFAASLTQRGAEYTGVDVSRKMLRTTYGRTNQAASLVQMDASNLGFRSYFDYVLCIRTFHFLPKPVEALQGMFTALNVSGMCLVTFETDNLLRRLLLFFGIGTSEQYYYKISDVEDLFLKSGFQVVRSGSVMRMPVTVYRRCPRSLLWILKRLERIWPWPMHDYVLGERSHDESYAAGPQTYRTLSTR
jgi:ubiquinone/menaquinone biosynthesis C-methylase UbiE